MPPIVGIPACARLMMNGQLRHDTPARYAAAVLGGAGAVPIMIPPMGEASLAVLDRLDGLLLSGSPSNVHPSHYDGGDSLTPEHARPGARRHHAAADPRGDRPRHAAAGDLPRHPGAERGPRRHAASEGARGAGRMDHRPGPGTIEREIRAAAPGVPVRPARAASSAAPKILVNSLHGQAIDTPAPGLVVEARGAGRHDRGGAGGARARLRASACSGTRNGATPTTPPAWRSSARSARRAAYRSDCGRRRDFGEHLRRAIDDGSATGRQEGADHRRLEGHRPRHRRTAGGRGLRRDPGRARPGCAGRGRRGDPRAAAGERAHDLRRPVVRRRGATGRRRGGRPRHPGEQRRRHSAGRPAVDRRRDVAPRVGPEGVRLHLVLPRGVCADEGAHGPA